MELHGMRDTKEYRAWSHLKDRCLNENNENFDNYGGRGLEVESSWIDSFETFYNHIGPCPYPEYSLDRIDNEKGYLIGNVRWASSKTQCRNKRTNNLITYKNITKTLMEWSEELNIPRTVITQRFQRGWNIEKTFETPYIEQGDKEEIIHNGIVKNIVYSNRSSHNMTKTKEYKTWKDIKTRCYNKNSKDYHNYGGKGLVVEEDWRNSFESFYNDIGKCPDKNYSLHRKNNDLGYIRGNVEWVDNKTQARNKTNNHYITYKEETKTLIEWSEITKIKRETIYSRLKRGWSVERTLETPCKSGKCKEETICIEN